ncbi:MAG: protein jag [Oscillospiraceae bacterium]|nr:protein jag [Oscillospiraceae bacterium]
MKFIDMTGKTEEEAIQKALKELGLERDLVSVEILERAKRGIFGIGATPAKVRVSYGLEEEPIVPVASIPTPPPAPAKPKAEPIIVEETAKAAPKAEKRKPRTEKRENIESKQEQMQSVPVETAAAHGEICTDEKAQQITVFLEGLLQHMNSTASVKVYLDEEGRYKVILEGEKLGQLIGRRGETLDAIQQLTNYSVNRGSDKRVRVHVDAENYRLKREQSLEHLAQKVAAKVLKYKRNVTLEPMNAYERHVIHTALQDVEGVTTYSMGTEPNRRVIVAIEKK